MTLPLLMLAKLLNVDDAKQIGSDALNALARRELRRRFLAAAPGAASRSAKRKSRREQVRSIEYLLWQSIVPRGNGLIADAIRDAHDDAVLAIVLPQVTASTTIDQVATLVVDAEIEVTF